MRKSDILVTVNVIVLVGDDDAVIVLLVVGLGLVLNKVVVRAKHKEIFHTYFIVFVSDFIWNICSPVNVDVVVVVVREGRRR